MDICSNAVILSTSRHWIFLFSNDALFAGVPHVFFILYHVFIGLLDLYCYFTNTQQWSIVLWCCDIYSQNLNVNSKDSFRP